MSCVRQPSRAVKYGRFGACLPLTASVSSFIARTAPSMRVGKINAGEPCAEFYCHQEQGVEWVYENV